MRRPRPTVSSQNRHQDFLHAAQELAGRLAAEEGVVGVLLVGGVARGHADQWSELDLAVYLTTPAFEKWTRHGQAPFPEGDSLLGGWHVDMDYLCFDAEKAAEWEHTKRWDRSYALALHDPQRLLANLVASKARLGQEEKDRLAMHHLMDYGEFFCDVVAPSWLQRGDLLAAHQSLNIALDHLVKAVFLANDELIPFEKWSLNLSYTLPWIPKRWKEKVEQALLVLEMSPADVERRRATLGQLLAACKEKVLPDTAGGLGLIEARKLGLLRDLRQKRAMPAAEFDRRFGLRRALQSPLFQLLRWETRAGQEWLEFDEQRLRDYAAHDFEGFLDWDRALLRRLVAEEVSS